MDNSSGNIHVAVLLIITASVVFESPIILMVTVFLYVIFGILKLHKTIAPIAKFVAATRHDLDNLSGKVGAIYEIEPGQSKSLNESEHDGDEPIQRQELVNVTPTRLVKVDRFNQQDLIALKHARKSGDLDEITLYGLAKCGINRTNKYKNHSSRAHYILAQLERRHWIEKQDGGALVWTTLGDKFVPPYPSTSPPHM